MLLESYTKEIFRAECNPGFEALHCFAHLDQDVSEAIPYLNATLGGFTYQKNPPSVTFKVHGKLITVHAKKIAINALKDEQEAIDIIEWLKREINAAWDNRDKIEPLYETAPQPKIIEILKLLPKTNCKECGQSTCMVFATQVAEGAKGPEDCLPLEDATREQLSNYLGQFRFDF
ncbi:MAG: Fe-S cluster protein [Deltaproteobacteria bacterium]|nr:Fe-S cluster protein [Deltaproteobacteria bacterium]MBW2570825.1 Fe-S cluster protein [Deltaproteobacteria bacterium]MBW2668323.1 Fe-S cluster protein [Deltaproteobacteria bacterium]